MGYPVCKLNKGRERSLQNRHPWIFSGAIQYMEEDVQPGAVVDVQSADGNFLARGYFNPNSQIRVRVLTFNDETIDTAFFAWRLRRAASWRRSLLEDDTDAFRLCNSEGDFLPGLIVDKYGDYIVVQLLTTGIESLRQPITDAISEVFSPIGIYEKSEGGYRKEEGLAQESGVLFGQEPPDLLRITECGLPFYVDIKNGQKTGFFLDQRKSRQMARSLSDGRTVLNCFGYSGAFTVACLAGGAKKVITIDTSQTALDIAKENVAFNGFDVNDEDYVKADVFMFLREFSGSTDFIILDPPGFAKSRASLQKASRAYKDINFNSIKMLPDTGLLMSFSCSGHVNTDLFQKIMFAASQDAERNLQILSKISNGIDHPINIYHPEGEYLNGFLCRVDNGF